jgi:hypothetical protein
MRFYCVSHTDCMTRGDIAVLQRHFMTALKNHAVEPVRTVAAAM